MDTLTIDEILKTLDAVHARPAMYFGNSSDLKAYRSFMSGFKSALWAVGIDYPLWSSFEEVFHSRGWKSSSIDIPDMEAKGLDDEQIIQELLLLEILIWKSKREALSR
jgi:hypothetical protein